MDHSGVKRRVFAALVVGTAIGLAWPAFAQSDYPSRNVTVVVPLGAGSASDIIARIVLDQAGRQLGKSFIIENRPGAGGSTGAGQVARSAPDGYTLLAYGALGSAHALYSKLPYDTLTAFSPIIALGQQPLVLVTPPAKGYKTLGDLLAAAKAKPGELNFSSVGLGSSSHFGAERLLLAAGVKIQHVPFKGSADSVGEVVAGRVDFTFLPSAAVQPLVAENKVVPLAVSAQKRTRLLPDVPTTEEAGIKNAVYTFYTGLFAPAKTPSEIVAKLHGEVVKALEAPDVRARMAKLGVEPMTMSTPEFTKFFEEDIAANEQLGKLAGIQRQ
jgi:tripartite-type tricarboxylate transporter receptor subunit TctC